MQHASHHQGSVQHNRSIAFSFESLKIPLDSHVSPQLISKDQSLQLRNTRGISHSRCRRVAKTLTKHKEEVYACVDHMTPKKSHILRSFLLNMSIRTLSSITRPIISIGCILFIDIVNRSILYRRSNAYTFVNSITSDCINKEVSRETRLLSRFYGNLPIMPF